MSVYLVKPTLNDESVLRNYIDELKDIDDAEGTNNLYSYLMNDEYPTWLDMSQKNNGNTFLIMNDINEIVGIISIRYKLSRSLQECGGHIGYNIRPSKRRKGYETDALKQVLYIAASHDLKEVYVDCYKDNEGSSKTIEAAGGELIRDEYNESRGHNVLRYKIDVRDLKINGDRRQEDLRRIDKIPKVIIREESYSSDSAVPIDRFMRKRIEVKERLALEYLSELVRINPNLTSDMISPDLAKYLGIAKREYKKEDLNNAGSRIDVRR